jgi:inhibitor of cysteine peptidase
MESDMQRFDDPAQPIHVRAGETFAIVLEGNPTTGYSWQADADPEHLQLLDQTFEQEGKGIGAGGREVLRFRAVSAGEVDVACAYKRPWDAKARETRRFQVRIT